MRAVPSVLRDNRKRDRLEPPDTKMSRMLFQTQVWEVICDDAFPRLDIWLVIPYVPTSHDASYFLHKFISYDSISKVLALVPQTRGERERRFSAQCA